MLFQMYGVVLCCAVSKLCQQNITLKLQINRFTIGGRCHGLVVWLTTCYHPNPSSTLGVAILRSLQTRTRRIHPLPSPADARIGYSLTGTRADCHERTAMSVPIMKNALIGVFVGTCLVTGEVHHLSLSMA